MAVPLFVSEAQAQGYPKAKKAHNAAKAQAQQPANNSAPANNGYYNNNNRPAPAPNNNYNNRPAPANNGYNSPPNQIPDYTKDYRDNTTVGSSPAMGSNIIMSVPNPNGGNPIFKSAQNPYKTEAEADAAFNKRYNSELSKWKTLQRGYLDNPKYFSRFDNNHLLEMYNSLSVLYSDLERDIVRSDEIDTVKPAFSLNIKMHAINSFEQVDSLAGFLEKELSGRKVNYTKIKRHVFPK
ncbi:hypothetical protein IJT93_00210 [bacterium]|nr:hypothetical protein [bacterium]